MPDEIRVTRPAQQPAVRPEQATPQEQSASGSSRGPWIILGVVIIVLVIIGLVFRGQLFGRSGAGGPAGSSPAAMGASGYEAVFLTNGQVYFGKLSNPNGDYVTLNDIYYLQVGPQQGSATSPSEASSTQAQTISLVKLGNELHGPVDEMHISRAQILFYEDLKSSGQVVTAIMKDKAAAAAPAQQQAPAPAQAPAK